MADSVGNLLGQRGTFIYTTDALEDVLITQDRSVGLAVGNPLATETGRPTSVRSRYLEGRYILCQAQDDPRIKKRIVVCTPDSSIFLADSSQEILINARIFVTTGRVGEKASFLRLTPLITPD